MLAAVKKAAGPTAVLKTVNYSLSPRPTSTKAATSRRVTGYTAANVVQVTLDDLTKISNVIDALGAGRRQPVRGIQFTLRDQDAVRAEALRKAAAKARGPTRTCSPRRWG